MAISLRITKQEEALYKDLADFYGITVSELIRQTMREMIEDYYDTKDAEKVYEEHLKKPETVSHEEFWKDLV